MRKRKKHDAESAAPCPVELCDLCAVSFPKSEAVCGYVPDSSSAHPTNDWFDGLRLVTACGDVHFRAVQERYRHRPFVAEELWAAKIARALSCGPPVLDVVQLACRTGLHETQIRRGVAWHNERLHEYQECRPDP
ncbi:hypothetical protein [Streptomyces sp. NPDC046197]|uniref:hypothetical protein n=1 Tax=Streptomyces sp. NPDC046197 TaxID=3154337 RepID=UPI0033DFDCFC